MSENENPSSSSDSRKSLCRSLLFPAMTRKRIPLVLAVLICSMIIYLTWISNSELSLYRGLQSSAYYVLAHLNQVYTLCFWPLYTCKMVALIIYLRRLLRHQINWRKKKGENNWFLFGLNCSVKNIHQSVSKDVEHRPTAVDWLPIDHWLRRATQLFFTFETLTLRAICPHSDHRSSDGDSITWNRQSTRVQKKNWKICLHIFDLIGH